MAAPGQAMDVVCPSCKVQNRIEVPCGVTLLMTKCSQCGTDFQVQAEAQPAPSPPMAVPVPVANSVQTSVPSAPAQYTMAAPIQPTAIPVAMPVQSTQAMPQYAQPMPPVIAHADMARQVQAQQPLVVPAFLDLPATPAQCTCQACGQVVVTNVHHEMGMGSWAVCLGFCCFTVGTLTCVGLLPCCVKDCQDAHHQCPQCRNHIGVKKFLF